MSKKSKKEKKSKKDKKDKEDKKQKKESKIEGRPQTAVEAMTSFFKDEPASRGDYYLAQKSERLLYEVGGAAADDGADAEGAGGTFVWRQKDKRSGLDRLEPEQVLLVNRLKREETERELEKLRRRKVERERERCLGSCGWGCWCFLRFMRSSCSAGISMVDMYLSNEALLDKGICFFGVPRVY